MKLTLGTYTKHSSKGIYQINLNTDTKRLEKLTLLAEIQNATYIAVDRNRLYAIVKDGGSGLRMYEDGRIVNQVTHEETPSCFVSCVPAKEIVMTANYHGGHIDLYSTQERKLRHLQRITYPEGSHAHCIEYVPRFNEVIVCDLGLDKVLAYSINDLQLVLKDTFYALPKQGPRHFTVHPVLPIIYVMTELSCEVLVLKRSEGAFELIQTLSTLPEGEDQIKSGSAIRISPDGKFLYVSNRGHDSITAFEIKTEGKLSFIQNISTFGKNPRDFNLSPDGRFVVVANLSSDSLTLFERDMEKGTITLLEKDVQAPEVTCILFDQQIE
ncbi:MAG: lactonase family protein [Erysipelotrichaceae bacterium]